MVVHERRHRPVRDAKLPGFAQNIEIVFDRRNRDGRPFVFPIGDQSIQAQRIQNRAREDMRTHFRALFQHDDIQIGVKLFQPDSRRQARGTRAHDDHIAFHRFAFNFGHPDAPWLTVPLAPAGRAQQSFAPRYLVSASSVKRNTAS